MRFFKVFESQYTSVFLLQVEKRYASIGYEEFQNPAYSIAESRTPLFMYQDVIPGVRLFAAVPTSVPDFSRASEISHTPARSDA